MKSKVGQLTELLEGAAVLSSTSGLAAYHAAHAAVSAGRKRVLIEKWSAIRRALNPYRVIVSIQYGPDKVRVYRPDTNAEMFL